MLSQSQSIKELATALAQAQAEMPAVQMDSENPFYKSKYASLGAVIQTSRPILAKNGLSIIQLPTSVDDKIGVTTILAHTSGEWVSDTLLISHGGGAKNPAQEAGQVISYFRRYGWAAVLGIYTEEDTDGNNVTPPQPKQATQVHLGATAPSGKAEISKWPEAVVAELVKKQTFTNRFNFEAAAMHSKVLKPGETGLQGVLYWADRYRMHRVSMEPADAALNADGDLLAERERQKQDSATEASQ